MIRRDVTRAEVDRYLAMFEKVQAKLGTAIAIETIISAERFGTGQPTQAPALDATLESAARDIVTRVCRVYHITVESLGDRGRGTAVVSARREACWRLRKVGLVLADVSRIVGVSESTAHSGVRAFTAELTRDPMLRRRVGVGVDREAARGAKPAAKRRAA